MARLVQITAASVVLVLLATAQAFAQAGGGSSRFSGGDGGGGYRGGGGYHGGGGYYGGGGYHGGGGYYGGGSSGSDGGLGGMLVILLIAAILLFTLGVPLLRRRARTRGRAARDARLSTASAEAAEDDPVFAAAVVKSAAAKLYCDIQRAWSARDDAALARMLGPDLLVEWRRRLADFATRGWVNEVSVLRGPEVQFVGLVNRAGSADDRVTVTVRATLHSVVTTADGRILHRDEDADHDGEVEVCEYWTLARTDDGDGWRLVSIEQEAEGAHHLDAPIVVAPWSDDERTADESLVDLVTADAPPPEVGPTELISVAFDGTAREAALDLSLADPRCSPDVLESAARRAVAAWTEAVDGDDDALLAIADPAAARALLYPGGEDGRERLVVRGPTLERLAITALHADREPLRMEVAATLRGPRYLEDRDTAAVLAGSRDRAARFTERWTFALNGNADAPWRLVGGPPVRAGHGP
jgi:predicted lipid-binding transport protein (Tim44 family)